MTFELEFACHKVSLQRAGLESEFVALESLFQEMSASNSSLVRQVVCVDAYVCWSA